MNPKMGRPRLNKESAKDVIKTQRYGDDESVLTSRAAKAAGQSESSFIREAAIKQARADRWGKCKFTKEQLHGEYIEFRLHSEKGVTHGVGRMEAMDNPKGLVAVDIFIDQLENGQAGGYRIWIGRKAVEIIDEHPKQGPVKFRLLG